MMRAEAGSRPALLQALLPALSSARRLAAVIGDLIPITPATTQLRSIILQLPTTGLMPTMGTEAAVFVRCGPGGTGGTSVTESLMPSNLDLSPHLKATDDWVDDLVRAPEWHDRQRAWSALLSVLHALRDCLGRDLVRSCRPCCAVSTMRDGTHVRTS